jgi:tetraacyldisaccharide 4'-kinase
MRSPFLSAPAFWQNPDARLAPLLLSPFGAITAGITARRLRRPGWRAPVPVICCGNLGVGGAGKTTLALDLLQRLHARGIDAHALTRGYGGTARGLLRVDPLRHDASLVGDEALLLARHAPTWVSADRAASARAATTEGAQCLVMDDGMQNPGLVQDCTLLVIDGEAGFGNGHLLPAGPLRESIAAGAARAHAAVLIGADRYRAARQLPDAFPVLPARLVMGPEAQALRGRRVAAFAGIGRPDKFFLALDAIGLEIVQRTGFPDHHRYRAVELDRLATHAQAQNAALVTTPKDAVRLPASFRQKVTVLGVGLRWDNEAALEALLDGVLKQARTGT